MKKIIMTGGGTAGHVTPNIALMPALKKEMATRFPISVLITESSKNLIEAQGIPYYGISSASSEDILT